MDDSLNQPKSNTSSDSELEENGRLSENNGDRGFVEIHSHVLPGMDDGPNSDEIAERLLLQALEMNFDCIACTVHQLGPFRRIESDSILKRFKEFNDRIQKDERFKGITLFPSAEWLIGRDFLEMYDEVSPNLLTINNAKMYCLIEFRREVPDFAIQAIDRLRIDSLIPVIAHIDRYTNARSDTGLLSELLEMGCVLQMNADSILGRMGSDIQSQCRHLLQTGYVQIVASDAHHPDLRPFNLSKAYDKIIKWVGQDEADLFCKINPMRVLENQPVLYSKPLGLVQRMWKSLF